MDPITIHLMEKKIILSPSESDWRNRLIYRHESGRYAFDFDACLEYLLCKGRELFGFRFQLFPQDYEMLFSLLAYAVRDPDTCSTYGIDLRKGILLSGPIGCGKSSFLSLIRFFMPAATRYKVVPCSHVAFEFSEKGYEVIKRYSSRSFHPGAQSDIPIHYCFDDLGTESEGQHYGMKTEVMAEILAARYDLFLSHHMITHLTTNLSSGEIESRYGIRIRSRMREMFNLIAFDRGAGDKRG